MNDFTAEFEPERFEHLTPQTALLLNAPLATRLAAIDEDIFIAWDGAENVLDALEHRYSMPSGPRRRCLLLIAMPGQGKTWVHREFLRRHQIDQETLLAKDGSRPVLLLSLASVSSEEDFLVRLISTLGAPVPTHRQKTREMKVRAIQLLRASGIRLLIMDECQDLGHLKPTEIPAVASYLRHITNEGGRPLVLMGSSEAHLLIATDEHLRTRFDVITLQPWRDPERARAFIYALLTQIPLPKPSPITDDDTIAKLLERVGGNTERIVHTIKGAARAALKSGAECIDRKLLFENIVSEPSP